MPNESREPAADPKRLEEDAHLLDLGDLQWVTSAAVTDRHDLHQEDAG